MNEEVRKLTARALHHQYRGDSNHAFISLLDAINVLNEQQPCECGNTPPPPVFYQCKQCGTKFQAGMVLECPACKAPIELLEVREFLSPRPPISDKHERDEHEPLDFCKPPSTASKPLTIVDVKRQVDHVVETMYSPKSMHNADLNSGIYTADGPWLIGDFEIRRRKP